EKAARCGRRFGVSTKGLRIRAQRFQAVARIPGFDEKIQMRRQRIGYPLRRVSDFRDRRVLVRDPEGERELGVEPGKLPSAPRQRQEMALPQLILRDAPRTTSPI